MVPLGLEVFLAEGGRKLFKFLLVGPPLARAGQRVVVDVGGVDLGGWPIFRCAECFAEEHGDAVGLFARGDARAPYPDRLVTFLFCADSWADLLVPGFPGPGISKVDW